MIELAAIYWIFPQYRICGWIDLCNFIRVSQIYVDLMRGRIILRHARFTGEFDCLDDLVFCDVDDRDSLSQGIGDVHFAKPSSVGATVRFRGGWQTLHYGHRLQVDDTDLLFTPIRRVHLMCSRHIFETGNAWQPRDRFHDFVRPQIYDVQSPGTEMSREQEVILIINSEIVKALTCGTGQIEFRNLSQRLTTHAGRRGVKHTERGDTDCDSKNRPLATYIASHEGHSLSSEFSTGQ